MKGQATNFRKPKKRRKRAVAKLWDNPPNAIGCLPLLEDSPEIEALYDLYQSVNTRLTSPSDQHLIRHEVQCADRWLRMAVMEYHQAGVRLRSELIDFQRAMLTASERGDTRALATLYEDQSPALVSSLQDAFKAAQLRPFQRSKVDWKIAAECARIVLMSADVGHSGNELRLVAATDRYAEPADDAWNALSEGCRRQIELVGSQSSMTLYRDPLPDGDAILRGIEHALASVPRGKRARPQLQCALLVLVTAFRNLRVQNQVTRKLEPPPSTWVREIAKRVHGHAGWTNESGSPTGEVVDFAKHALSIYGLKYDARQLMRQALEKIAISRA